MGCLKTLWYVLLAILIGGLIFCGAFIIYVIGLVGSVAVGSILTILAVYFIIRSSIDEPDNPP